MDYIASKFQENNYTPTEKEFYTSLVLEEISTFKNKTGIFINYPVKFKQQCNLKLIIFQLRIGTNFFRKKKL